VTPMTCRWCGLTHDSPHSEVIHRGTQECVDTQACESRMHEAELDALRKQHRAELLAFGERVREEAASALLRSIAGYNGDDARIVRHWSAALGLVRAVDVARLLEEGTR
jgi:hypothetical protein